MGTMKKDALPKKERLTPQAELQMPVTEADLKQWRKKMGWTQKDAANWLGVSFRSYESWECSHRNPQHPIAIRARMAEAENRMSRSAARKRQLTPKGA